MTVTLIRAFMSLCDIYVYFSQRTSLIFYKKKKLFKRAQKTEVTTKEVNTKPKSFISQDYNLRQLWSVRLQLPDQS